MPSRPARRSPASPPASSPASILRASSARSRTPAADAPTWCACSWRSRCAARPMMQRVASALGISAFEFAHVEAVLRIQRGAFRPAGAAGQQPAGAREASLAQAYRVLETTPAASDEDVAKAYRRQLSRHHPDKLKANGLPDSMVEHAKQRTQQIIEAWEVIRAQRGLR